MANILYAEDDDSMRTVAAAMLNRRGHEVTAVADGSSAISALTGDVKFEVLLTDGSMPGASGLEVIAAAQKMEQPPGVIILYTANKVKDVIPGVVVLDKLENSASGGHTSFLSRQMPPLI